MSIKGIGEAIRSKLNRADRISLRFALAVLVLSMLVSSVLLIAAGTAPHERLAIYLLEWMGTVQLLVSLPFWFVARGLRAAGLSMQSAYVRRRDARRASRATPAPRGGLVHG